MAEEYQHFKQRFYGSNIDPAELTPDFLRDLFQEMDCNISELQEQNQMLRQELDASREHKQAVEELLDRATKAQNRNEKSKLAEDVRAEKTRLQLLVSEDVNANIAQAWRECERKLDLLLAETQSALDAAEDGVAKKLTEKDEELRSLHQKIDMLESILRSERSDLKTDSAGRRSAGFALSIDRQKVCLIVEQLLKIIQDLLNRTNHDFRGQLNQALDLMEQLKTELKF